VAADFDSLIARLSGSSDANGASSSDVAATGDSSTLLTSFDKLAGLLGQGV
jgi:hypothetical protein